MSLTEPNQTSYGSDNPKIEVLQVDGDTSSCSTFRIQGEDHTLLNALRYIIMKNPSVTFCAYSIPHPSESLVNLRIQTDGTVTCVDAFHRGLDNLIEQSEFILQEFRNAKNKFNQ